MPEINLLTNLIVNISYLFDEYEKLYCENEEIINLLNQASADFFYYHQVNTLDIISMKLGKLLDPAGSKNNKNLSLELLSQIADQKQWPCANQIKNQLHILKNSASYKSLKKRRNKILAHNDLKSLKSNKVEPINVEYIRNILTSIQNIMNLYYQDQQATTLEFKPVSFDGVYHLFDILNNSHIYEQLKQKRNSSTLNWEEKQNLSHDAFKSNSQVTQC